MDKGSQRRGPVASETYFYPGWNAPVCHYEWWQTHINSITAAAIVSHYPHSSSQAVV